MSDQEPTLDEQASEDEEANREDYSKLEFTDKSTTPEDGDQPQMVPPWNDDSGEYVAL